MQVDTPVIAGTDLTVRAVCETDFFGNAYLEFRSGPSTDTYFVHGAYFIPAGHAFTLVTGATDTIPNGAGMVAYQQNGPPSAYSRVAVNAGELAGDLIVERQPRGLHGARLPPPDAGALPGARPGGTQVSGSATRLP